MYAYLTGNLTEAMPHNVILDVNGVGYSVCLPANDFEQLPPLGTKVTLYTYFVVRETSHMLYGFLNKESRLCFSILITINGVGPKMGLSILGSLSAEELQQIVDEQDHNTLSRVPGIGKKTAEKLIRELSGRLVNISSSPIRGKLQEALKALMQLGMSPAEAKKAVTRASQKCSPEECDLSTLISLALKTRSH